MLQWSMSFSRITEEILRDFQLGFTLLWMSPHSLQTDTCVSPMPNKPYWLFVLLLVPVFSQALFALVR